jgi:signal peptidase I
MIIERLLTKHGIMRSLGRTSTQSSLLSLQRCSQSLFISAQDFAGVSHELLNLGYGVRFRASGRSMHPTIADGELMTVEPMLPSDLKRGDVVLYSLERGVIAHRVVRIEKRNGGAPCFILRGDALGSPDEPVEVDQILGKVVSVEREGRSIDLYSRKVKIIRTLRLCASHIKKWARNFFYTRLPWRGAARNEKMTQTWTEQLKIETNEERNG